MQGVQGNIDPGKPGLLERLRLLIQPDAVGGRGDGELGMTRPKCGDDLDEVRSDQRLSSSDSEFPHTQALDADAHDSLDLTCRHDGFLR